MSIDHYEGYFDQDEDNEVSHEVIDPEWEQQQKKAFLAWCNSHLRKRGDSIGSIENDFRDGLKLIKLLEIISGDVLPKPDKGIMRLHKIANVNKALNFIESKGVKLVMISAEDIVDGNVKMTLGMIWTIILRFAIQDIKIEDLYAKDGLLAWCQKKTKNYKDVNIVNFHTSFQNGLAFCALIHHHRADLIDYDSLSKDDPITNLNLAFDVAERHLDIPRMLEPQYITSSAKPDEFAILTYISSYYHCFTGSDKARIAANRISDVLKTNRDIGRLEKEYTVAADELLDWIKAKQALFSTRSPPSDTETAEKLLDECRDYNIHERPEKLREKSRLEMNFNKIQTYLRLNHRSPYVPAVEKQLANIADQWTNLDEASKEYKDFLLIELQRLNLIDCVLFKFNVRCSTHEAWAAGQPEGLKSNDYLSCNLPELRALQTRHEAFLSQVVANSERVNRIRTLVNELQELQYCHMDVVNQRFEAVLQSMEDIKQLSSIREQKLKDLLPVLEQIDQLHLKFATQSAPFKIWASQTEEDLRDMPNFYTLVDVEKSFQNHVDFEETLAKTELECQEIENFAKQVAKLTADYHLVGTEINPYTEIKPGEIEKCMQNVLQLTAERNKVLCMEKQKQQDNEKLRQDFVLKGMAFDKSLQDQKANIAHHTVEAKGPLEEQLENLKKIEKDLYNLKPQLDDLERCSQVLDSAFRAGESDFTVSMPTLHISWEQLIGTLSEAINLIENRILTRDTRGLSAEQMSELQNSFRQFDRNKSGCLDPPEFKAFLLSVGHSFTAGRKESSAVISEHEFSQIMKVVDPDRKGYVTFNAFLDYMTRENNSENTMDQIVQSFLTIAGDKGYLTAHDIEQYLPKEDATYCIAHMIPLNGPLGDSGGLDYRKFAHEFHTSGLTT